MPYIGKQLDGSTFEYSCGFAAHKLHNYYTVLNFSSVISLTPERNKCVSDLHETKNSGPKSPRVSPMSSKDFKQPFALSVVISISRDGAGTL